jgi:V8-like Glu-specific endopeptidase
VARGRSRYTRSGMRPHAPPRVDTTSGQSGAPVLEWGNSSCGSWCATGIHTAYDANQGLNEAARITQSVYNNMRYWLQL